MSDDLINHAATVSPEEFGREVGRLGDMLAGDDGIARFEQQRRATRLRHGVDRVTGMHWLHGELDPETGSVLFTALQRQLDQWFHNPDSYATGVVPELVDDHEHLAAHAITHLCTSRATNTGGMDGVAVDSVGGDSSRGTGRSVAGGGNGSVGGGDRSGPRPSTAPAGVHRSIGPGFSLQTMRSSCSAGVDLRDLQRHPTPAEGRSDAWRATPRSCRSS